jgi:hypothetical protein
MSDFFRGGNQKMNKFMSYLAAVSFMATMLVSGPSAQAAAARAATTAAATPAQFGGPGSEPWAVPNSRWQAVQQRGFRDGITGARRDAQNNRQPNVNNRDEFRNPPVRGRDRRAYRDGFRQGYWTGVRHLMGYYHGPFGG